MYLFATFFAAAVIYGAGAFQCQYPEVKEDIDWARLAKISDHWYEALIIPEMVHYADCFDWANLRPIEGGFDTDIGISRVEDGEEKTEIGPIRGIRQENGLYKFTRKYETEYLAAAKRLNAHLSPEYLMEVAAFVEGLYEVEWQFYTDYKDFFYFAVCFPQDGWVVGFKTRTREPTLQMFVNMVNSMTENGISGNITATDWCYDLDTYEYNWK